MKRKEHDEVFTDFSLKTMDHLPSQKYLEAQWSLAVITGVCDENPEKLKRILFEEWENGGKDLFYQQRASRN